MKICCRCDAELPLGDFPRDCTKEDGHRACCRACDRKRRKECRARLSVEKRREMTKYCWSDDPEVKKKHLARKKVWYAVKIGRLTKSDRCSSCGQEGYVEAHHDDYDKPLDVAWLCKSCHSEHAVKIP